MDEFQAGDLSVRASLTQSYRALDGPTRTAFRRLALLDSAEFAEWQVAALLDIFSQLQLDHYAMRARETLMICRDSQRAGPDQPPEVRYGREAAGPGAVP